MHPENVVWDAIIVGAGPAGLTMARRILQKNPMAKILILERSKFVGGRTRTLTFAGKTELPCGAGVGRTTKDHRLAAWLTEMGFEKQTWVSPPSYVFLHVDSSPMPALQDLVKRLKAAVRPSDCRRTFRAFAMAHLSPAEWKWFQSAMGYTDYLEADAWETVMYYGFEDNMNPLHGFNVPWTALMETTYHSLKKAGVVFRFGADVLSVKYSEAREASEARAAREVKWRLAKSATPTKPETLVVSKSKVIIVATPIQSLRALFPKARAYHRDALQGQPFIRLYTVLNAEGRLFMKTHAHNVWHQGMAMVEGALQKISVIDPTKGLYRLAYADNKRALALRRSLNSKDPVHSISDLLRKAILPQYSESDPKNISYISKWKACSWFPTGTHYYPPLPSWADSREAFIREAQRPFGKEPIWVIGEAVSRDQGWTEGALASVEAVLKEIFSII